MSCVHVEFSMVKSILPLVSNVMPLSIDLKNEFPVAYTTEGSPGLNSISNPFVQSE